MAFVAMETGLKIGRISGLPGGTPEFRQCTSRVVTGLFQEAVEDHLAGLMTDLMTDLAFSRSHD